MLNAICSFLQLALLLDLHVNLVHRLQVELHRNQSLLQLLQLHSEEEWLITFDSSLEKVGFFELWLQCHFAVFLHNVVQEYLAFEEAQLILLDVLLNGVLELLLLVSLRHSAF